MEIAGVRKLRVVVAKPGDDIPELERLGVAAVFTPGAPPCEIVDFLLQHAGERTPA